MTKSRNRRGRPRKDGPRYPSGELRPPEPNPRVIADRRALLGTLNIGHAAAEDAMLLALARGWLTEDQHRAGEAYARVYRIAHPQRTHGGLGEAPEPVERDKRPIAQMGGAEIVAAFDAIMEATPMPTDEQRQADARRRYVDWTHRMTAAEQQQVFECFCLRSWPMWVINRAAGREGEAAERRRDLLVSGLDALVSVRMKEAA